MGRYLLLLSGAADANEKAELSEQQQAEFMSAWSDWAHGHDSALLDPGAPLFRKKRVTTDGVEDFEDSKIAYAIIRAETHESAVRIAEEHPHLRLFPGNSIEVIECPSMAPTTH